jgi:hypothetical protein
MCPALGWSVCVGGMSGAVRVWCALGLKKFWATTTAILIALGATREGTANGKAVGVLAGAGLLMGTHIARLPIVRNPTNEPLPKCVRGKRFAAVIGVTGPLVIGGARP